MQKRSFRQVGRASTVASSKANAFSLRKRRPKNATKVSIPSKFAKRPYVAEPLDKAFGSKTSRFEKARQTAQPGPGQYYESQPFSKPTPSLSSRGFGSMASKSTRFRPLSTQKRTIPAPGAYTPADLTSRPIAPVRAETDSVFKSRTNKLTFMEAKLRAGTPAPGVYDLTKAKRKIYGKSSTFSSRTARCTYMKVRDSPAPGAYNPEQIQSKPANKHSAMFTSKQDRIPSRPNRNPGPGEYDFYTSFVRGLGGQPSKTSALHTRNSVYANDNLDRWGKPYKPKVDRGPVGPGPGDYAREYKPKSKKPVSSSWALSNVGRWRNGSSFQMRTPGPAYYTSRSGKKADESFHLNKAGRWL